MIVSRNISPEVVEGSPEDVTEVFRDMEMNILKSFHGARASIPNHVEEAHKSDSDDDNLAPTPTIKCFLNEKYRMRTISSINDENILDLIMAKAPLQVCRKKPSAPLQVPAGALKVKEAPSAPVEDPAPSRIASILERFKRAFSFTNNKFPEHQKTEELSYHEVRSAKYHEYLENQYETALSAERLDATIRCVAAVVISFIVDADGNFDLDTTSPAYGVFLDNPTSTSSVPLPSMQEVQTFITDIYTYAQLEFESLITALIYVDRLRVMTQGNLCICHENWQSILFVALNVASRMWDDFAMVNSDLACLYEKFPLIRLNMIEKTFIELLDYKLMVSKHEYAKYFYHIHKIQQKAQDVQEANAIESSSIYTTHNGRSLKGTLPSSPTSVSTEHSMTKMSYFAEKLPLAARVFTMMTSSSRNCKVHCDTDTSATVRNI